jgi:nitroimidazol reductase NimA-like FMN-containing flavoprotein (pyridoxamine 5'-phosphate oxidase superfamily)
MIESLSHDEALMILESGCEARLGCIADGEPYVVPVYYVLEGDYAYLHSLPGKKIDAMRELPRVCLQVQVVKSEHRWRSVQAFGTYEEIDDEGERERVFEMLFQHFPRLTPADAVRRYGHLTEPSIAFRICIDRIVGVGEG